MDRHRAGDGHGGAVRPPRVLHDLGVHGLLAVVLPQLPVDSDLAEEVGVVQRVGVVVGVLHVIDPDGEIGLLDRPVECR